MEEDIDINLETDCSKCKYHDIVYDYVAGFIYNFCDYKKIYNWDIKDKKHCQLFKEGKENISYY